MLLQWLSTLEGLEGAKISTAEHQLVMEKIPMFEEVDIIECLQDGVMMMEALSSMDPDSFKRN